MAFQQSPIGATCEAMLREAYPNLSDDGRKELQRALMGKAAELLRREKHLTDGQALVLAGRSLDEEKELADKIELRSRLFAVATKKERFTFYDQYKGKEADALQALVVGKEGPEFGFGRSTEVQIRVERDRLITPLNLELEKAQLHKALGINDRGFQLDLAKEMARASGGTEAATNNPIAENMGKLLAKALETAVALRNDAGAWTRKLPGYIINQSRSHDQIKIRGKNTEADFKAWNDFTAPLLAPEVLADIDMRKSWSNLATGIHHKGGESDWLVGFKGGSSNIAKRASQERKFHFKDATSWHQYHERYGTGTIQEAVFQGLEHMARDIGLMKVWGPNPRAAFEADLAQLKERADFRNDETQKLALKQNRLSDLFGIVDGTADIPGNASVARWGRNGRAVMSIVKLNGGLISSFPDIAARASTLRWNGMNTFEALTNGVFAWMKGRPDLEKREFLARAIGVSDGVIGSIVGRYNSGEELSGIMAKAVGWQMRLNGQRYGTETLMYATVDDISTTLGFHRGSKLADLPDRLKLTLGRYGIDDAKWDFARAHAVERDGVHYVLGDQARHFDAAEVRAIIGDKATEMQVKRWRDDMEGTWRGYFDDQVREGLTEPSAMTKYVTTWGGLAPGSVGGEIARSVMQFKSFSIGTVQRHLNREWNRGGTPDAAGIASFIVGLTVLGYISGVAKDLLGNKTPKAWANPFESHKAFGQDVKLITDALVRGGGLGILGDFLFQDYNKSGAPGIASVLGPVAGSAGQVLSLINSYADEASGVSDHNLASRTIQAVQSHLPLINLWWTKSAVEYLIVHRMQESVNPGYLQRMERRLDRENHQQPILSVR